MLVIFFSTILKQNHNIEVGRNSPRQRLVQPPLLQMELNRLGYSGSKAFLQKSVWFSEEIKKQTPIRKAFSTHYCSCKAGRKHLR